MAWRVAKSLEVLRAQINALYPNRNKENDGTIGDERHQASNSDHNPWVKDGTMGVVTALDITNDPAHGCVSNDIAEHLRTSGDHRVKYVISNKRIANPSISGGAWRPYNGINAHDHHFHLSVKSDKALYDETTPWDLSGIKQAPKPAEKPQDKPVEKPATPVTPEKPYQAKVYVYCMYGLGGRIWSAAIEDLVAANIRKLPNVICPPTISWTEWKTIVDKIKAQPKGSKTVLIAHSMGAASATYVTDYVPVDLLVLYDTAGEAPSRIGKNTGHCIDIYDTLLAIVPKFRVQAVAGYENRIERWTTKDGHTGQDDDVSIEEKVKARVEQLTK